MLRTLKNYQFKPNVKLLSLGLILLPLLIALGCWQLQRANFKRQLQEQYTAHATQAPIPYAQALSQKDNHFLAVKMQGEFDNSHVILLDNKFYNHQVGYQVIVPFTDQETASHILINLGWIAQGTNRQQLPTIAAIKGKVLIHGVLNDFPKKTFTLGKFSDTPSASWPLRLQQLNQDFIQQKLGYPLAPFVIVLAPNEPFGYAHVALIANLKPQMHLGYAFQWFALAATLLMGLLITSFKRKEKNANSN